MTPPGSAPPELSHAIDLIEACYDLDKPQSAWLDALADVGAPLFDHGHGFAIDEYVVSRSGRLANVSIEVVRKVGLPRDYDERVAQALAVLPPEMLANINPPGYAGTWTEMTRNYPVESRRVLETFGYGDLLGILASDPNGIGIRITAPLSDVVELLPKSREEWQMLGAHIASAYRLRRALASAKIVGRAAADRLPHRAEGVIDPKQFRVVDAIERGRGETARACLRRGARWVDRARSIGRQQDPREALRTWRALVCGRWSLVDWFDTDERRFMLAIPNPPEVRDPRGLSEQECQAVEYAVRGDSNKIIAYRLGLSQARVSTLLSSAMKKLGVKTRAQLVEKLPPLPMRMEAPREPAAG
ncbi:MAG: LuxR C-terminal-related transcriptional regulator [Myxococcales bacterium]